MQNKTNENQTVRSVENTSIAFCLHVQINATANSPVLCVIHNDPYSGFVLVSFYFHVQMQLSSDDYTITPICNKDSTTTLATSLTS